jgi:hypothetical protein
VTASPPPQPHIRKVTETTSVKCATRRAHSQNAHGATSFGTPAVSTPSHHSPSEHRTRWYVDKPAGLSSRRPYVKRGCHVQQRNTKQQRDNFYRAHITQPTKTHSFPLVTYPTAKTPVQQRTSVKRADDIPDSQPTPKRHRITPPTKKRARDFNPPEPPPKKPRPTLGGTKRKRATSIQAPKKPDRRKK